MRDDERAVVVGAFRERSQLQDAIAALKAAGFAGNAIEVLSGTPGATEEVTVDPSRGPAAPGQPADTVGDLPAASVDSRLSEVVLGGGKGVVAATLTGLGFAPSDADWYEREVTNGATVVWVNGH